MILGVGTDICAIARIEKALEKPRFLDRWFTAAEKEYILSRRGADAKAPDAAGGTGIKPASDADAAGAAILSCISGAAAAAFPAVPSGACSPSGAVFSPWAADTSVSAGISGAELSPRAASAAGIFAAKEAVSKALGTGFSGFGPVDVEILRDGRGRPFCILHRGAKARAEAIGTGSVMVSISHDGGMAVAFALAQEERPAGEENPARKDGIHEP